MLKVVHYINQFFGGIGGEDQAGVEPRLMSGPVGPGRAFQIALKDQAEIVGTVVCGDNYFVDNLERATREVLALIEPVAPDLLIAGPAFNAGRFGIACGAVCQAAARKLGIPVVTGMHEENPGVDLYRRDAYVLKTQDSVRGMNPAVAAMSRLALKLASGRKIGRPDVEGYFGRGSLVNEVAEMNGARRLVAMLLDKLNGRPFATEVAMPNYDRVQPAAGVRDIRKAVVALVTDGGLVPKGNPDNIEIKAATRFGKYSIEGKDALAPEDYEVSHAGYDSVFVRQDPNRLVPVDVMRDMEKEGVIGRLHGAFYTTAGVANIVENVVAMGRAIAEDLKASEVSAAILTST